MTLIVTITDDKTENSQSYDEKEVDMKNILTDNALKIARVLVSGEKVENVLGSN